MRQFLDLLDDEWATLVNSANATRALDRWKTDPALSDFADLEAAVVKVQRRGMPTDSDRILLALLLRAPGDSVAARTVLQAIMPGLKSLMSAYQLTGDPEEVATAVIEAAFERIVGYPCERRPSRVAANLLYDTRQTLGRTASKERKFRSVTQPLTASVLERVADQRPDAASATDELVNLVDEAVRSRHLYHSGAQVILWTRVLDVSIEDLAAATGIKAQTIRKRRRTAEATLGRMAVA